MQRQKASCVKRLMNGDGVGSLGDGQKVRRCRGRSVLFLRRRVPPL